MTEILLSFRDANKNSSFNLSISRRASRTTTFNRLFLIPTININIEIAPPSPFIERSSKVIATFNRVSVATIAPVEIIFY